MHEQQQQQHNKRTQKPGTTQKHICEPASHLIAHPPQGSVVQHAALSIIHLYFCRALRVCPSHPDVWLMVGARRQLQVQSDAGSPSSFAVEVVIPLPLASCVPFKVSRTSDQTVDQTRPGWTRTHITPDRMGMASQTGSRGPPEGQKRAPPPPSATVARAKAQATRHTTKARGPPDHTTGSVPPGVFCSTILVAGRPLVPSLLPPQPRLISPPPFLPGEASCSAGRQPSQEGKDVHAMRCCCFEGGCALSRRGRDCWAASAHVRRRRIQGCLIRQVMISKGGKLPLGTGTGTGGLDEARREPAAAASEQATKQPRHVLPRPRPPSQPSTFSSLLLPVIHSRRVGEARQCKAM